MKKFITAYNFENKFDKEIGTMIPIPQTFIMVNISFIMKIENCISHNLVHEVKYGLPHKGNYTGAYYKLITTYDGKQYLIDSSDFEYIKENYFV